MAISPADHMIQLYNVEFIHLSSISNDQASCQFSNAIPLLDFYAALWINKVLKLPMYWLDVTPKRMYMNHSNFLALTVFWFDAGMRGSVIESNCRERGIKKTTLFWFLGSYVSFGLMRECRVINSDCRKKGDVSHFPNPAGGVGFISSQQSNPINQSSSSSFCVLVSLFWLVV